MCRYVDTFFREERLPIEEGWKRSAFPITSDLLDPLEKQILKASDWQGDIEGQCAWVRTAPNDDLDTVGPS